MNRLLFITSIFLIGLAQSCNQQGNREKQNNQTRFYSAEDYSSVEKIDMHIHYNIPDTVFTELAREDNFRLLNIVDDRPFGLPMDKQQEVAELLIKAFPGRIATAATFSVKDWNEAAWEKQTLSYLEDCISKGAIAVKIWKNIGMDLKDPDGRFVMIDDSRLDPILNFLAQNKITLLGHNGEPKDCWLPVEEMQVNGNKNYYSQHPEYHMYLHPEYPSYDDQINARDRMLEKHPDLKFIGCHLGSLEWSLEELAKRFDRFPNMSVDLSRMSNLHIHAATDWQKTRDFFIKYHDRLVYGTDKSVNKTADPEKMRISVHNSWLSDWKFFATDEVVNDPDIEGGVKGLNLPADVIDDIYRRNAEKWLKGI